MQVDGEPSMLVEVVNAFQEVVDDPQRFQPDAHIALRQAVPELELETALVDLVTRLRSSE